MSNVIARFALPRLKRFKELNNGHPGRLTEEKWDAMLDDMIFAMECLSVSEVQEWEFCQVERERVNRGTRLFGKYFQALWW